ncbi:hypothetical protein CBL_04796 [Carabus blaptoides fortunei]
MQSKYLRIREVYWHSDRSVTIRLRPPRNLFHVGTSNKAPPDPVYIRAGLKNSNRIVQTPLLSLQNAISVFA